MSADSNKVSEDIEKAKAAQKVTFADSAIAEDGDGHGRAIITSFAASTKKQSKPWVVKKDVLRCLREGRGEEMKTIFASLQEMKEFYSREGASIFSWATVGTLDDGALSSLVKNLPRDIVHDTLAKDGFSVLNEFVSTQKFMEKSENLGEEKNRIDAIKKLNILLQMGDAEITQFIHSNTTEKTRAALKLKT